VFAGGPAPLVATALFAAFGSAYAIAVYILRVVVGIVATAFLPDYTNHDISGEHQRARPRPPTDRRKSS
jgi:hypothetical protein